MMIRVFLTFLAFGIAANIPALAQEKPVPHELAQIAGQLEGTKEPLPLIGRGKALLEASTSLTDELLYLNAVGKKKDVKLSEQVFQQLILKHQDDNSALAQIYTTQADLDLVYFNDSMKSLAALNMAQQVREKIEVNETLERLKLWEKLGEAYLTSQKPEDIQGDRQQAKTYFQKIVEYSLNDQVYFARVKEFQNIQIEAALRLVSLTTPHDLPQLHLPLFAYDAIYDQFPDKAKLLNGAPPELAKFNSKIVTWLDLEVKNQTGDSPILPQLQAVLDWFKKQNHL